MDNFMYFFYLKVPKGNPYHSATSGEMAIYRANSIILKQVIK
jgi:UDP-sugar pyrophosphorylase